MALKKKKKPVMPAKGVMRCSVELLAQQMHYSFSPLDMWDLLPRKNRDFWRKRAWHMLIEPEGW